MDSQIKDISQLLTMKFDTRNELLYAVRRFYGTKGYVLSIRGSRPDKYVNLRCERSGCYRDTRQVSADQRKRKRTSRLIGCPFEIRGKRKEEGHWMVEIREPRHNHGPDAEGESMEVMFVPHHISIFVATCMLMAVYQYPIWCVFVSWCWKLKLYAFL
jgi:FAR1 DNA-binding domain